MSPEQIARYRAKAATAAEAWQEVLGEAPTRVALILAMAVAELETGLGNIKGRNWGSVHKRPLSEPESSILLGHGVFPTGSDPLATARGLLAPTQAPDELLIIDQSPIGPYFVWIWSFRSDLDAAKKFLEILIKRRATVRAIIDSASPTSLSAAMYATHYFEGTSKDPRENIRAYASRIQACAERIESALLGWPPAPPATGGATAGVGTWNPPAPERRTGTGWWLAGIALVGLGAFFVGRRA